MNLHQITGTAFVPLFHRLMAAYQHRVPKEWVETTTSVYFDAVRRFDTGIVEQAVTQLIEEPHRFFPKANQLRGACFAAQRALQPKPAAPVATDVCPCCGTSYLQTRTWLTVRKAPRSDRRPVVLEVVDAGGVVRSLVKASRDHCDCGFQAVLRTRLDLELRVMPQDDPDVAAEMRRRATVRRRFDEAQAAPVAATT